MGLDDERILHAERRARDGETAAARELLWQLFSDISKRAHDEEPPLALRRRALELLAAIAPEDVDVACACARILLPDQVEAALGVIRSALRLSPRSIAAMRVLAEVHRVGEQEDKALEAYDGLLRACREAIGQGVGVLSGLDEKRLSDIDLYMRYGLVEKADDHLKPLLERDTLHPGVHRRAAEIAHLSNKPPDRGAEHEILSCLLLVAHGQKDAARVAFARARDRYADVGVLAPLAARVL